MTKDDLAKRIRDTRQARGLSLDEVVRNASLANYRISRSYLAKLEAGASDPTAKKLEAVAAGLGVLVTELLVARHGFESPSELPAPNASQPLPVRFLKVVGVASCGEGLWEAPTPRDEVYPMPVEAGGDVVVRADGDSMSGHGILHGDLVVVERSDPGQARDGDAVLVEQEGSCYIKMLRGRGAEKWLEEQRIGEGVRRLDWPKAKIVARVVGVFRKW